jgi:ferredoxin
MILYFSATGNTEFIAQELAKRLDDECVNLLERIRTQDHTPLHSEKPFIICSPVYVCEMPRFLSKYLKEQTFSGSKDVYFFFASGGYYGIAGVLAKSLFKKKNMVYHGHAEFRMPSNYVASSSYNMSTREEAEKRILAAYQQLDSVVADILAGNTLPTKRANPFEMMFTLPLNAFWCKYKLTAKAFHVKDSCVGCQKCAQHCPLNNIKMVNQRPSWGKKCTHCMACIGNCPSRAIEYGKITQNKEQYNFSKYEYVVKDLKK